MVVRHHYGLGIGHVYAHADFPDQQSELSPLNPLDEVDDPDILDDHIVSGQQLGGDDLTSEDEESNHSGEEDENSEDDDEDVDDAELWAMDEMYGYSGEV
jgi:hypothetical protein